MKTTAPDITTVAKVNDIFARIGRGEPVPQQIIDRLPRDVRASGNVTLTTAEGKRVAVVIEIYGGEVTVRPADRNDAPGTPIQ